MRVIFSLEFWTAKTKYNVIIYVKITLDSEHSFYIFIEDET